MDPKATAKSKRGHTQHGRRAHAPPAAIAHRKKAAAAAGGDKAAASTYRSLPSNWDRYDDADEGIDTDFANKEVLYSGEIEPKSKGADFGYLMEQARSQPKEFGSSAFDEFSSDFMQGVSSMLSVRGKELLSLCGDDNFIVDDDSTSNYEVPFLSMDLNAVSAQLSKLKLSQRLFLEPDLFPEEMSDEESATTSTDKNIEILEPDELDRGTDSEASHTSTALVNNSNRQGHKHCVFKDDQMKLQSEADQDKPRFSPQEFTMQEDSNSLKLNQSSRSELHEPVYQVVTQSISGSEHKKATRFEAAAAEAELDMLLNSFSETSLSGSMSSGLASSNATLYSPSYGSLAPNNGQDPDTSKNVPTNSIDDLIDDLLTETSISLNDPKQTAVPSSRSVDTSNLRSNGAILDSIDLSIDDLLAETSLPLQQQTHGANQRKMGTVSSSKGLSHKSSSIDSKAMDHDFDSWIDTL